MEGSGALGACKPHPRTGPSQGLPPQLMTPWPRVIRDMNCGTASRAHPPLRKGAAPPPSALNPSDRAP